MTEHYSTDGPICPHCGETQTPDEGFYYDENLTRLECGSCGEPFGVSVYNSTSWITTAPVDRSGEAGETALAGSTEGESAVPAKQEGAQASTEDQS